MLQMHPPFPSISTHLLKCCQSSSHVLSTINKREQKSKSKTANSINYFSSSCTALFTCEHIPSQLLHHACIFPLKVKARLLPVSSRNGVMARSWRWIAAVRRALARSSCTSSSSSSDLDAIKNNNTVYNALTVEEEIINESSSSADHDQDSSSAETDDLKETANSKDEVENVVLVSKEEAAVSREHLAAMTIQAYFRGHLARRAFRALKSLVRLQAVVRGVCVRRQERVAIHCMQALVRLQVRVRGRQLLDKSENVQLPIST